MEFKPEQPKRELSDAELMEERTSKLISELRDLGREVKDFFEKRRAVEAMIRKRLEEGLDRPERKAEPTKEPEDKQKEVILKKKEAEMLDSELEKKIRAMLDYALETRNIVKDESKIKNVDKVIEELKDILRKAKLNTLLDSITEEVEKRKEN